MLEIAKEEADKSRADNPGVDNQTTDILVSNTPSASDSATSTPAISATVTPQISTLSPDSTIPATLSALSRNASVISTSSSDSGPTSLLLTTPRPRPARTFSAPRSQSPHSRSPSSSFAPSYLAQELGMSAGSRTLTLNAKSRSKSRSRNVAVTADDFKFGALLGEGSYSTVKLATHIRTGQQYAIKVLEKAHLIKKDKMSTALAEKNALVRLGAGHPGIVRLFYAFHDEWRLYFVIDLARNGEMQSLISRLGSLSTKCTQYYAAQVVDALDYMHTKGVIHRDLKPENLLLDDDFRIKITDFGTGKILETGTERAESWVGTAQYVAPELLEAKETSRSSDFWALGCIIYQMVAGRLAFQGLSEYLTWQKIKQLEYTFPEGFDVQAQDLIQRLLVRDPAQRLGVGLPGTGNDMQALRSHPFFASINWDTLWIDPPPVLEPGLVKRDMPLAMKHEQDWDDVGVTWDNLVGEGSDYDDLEWASDGEAPDYELRSYKYLNTVEGGIPQEQVDIGPLGEIRRPVPLRRESQTTMHTTTPTFRETGKTSTRIRGSSFSGSPPSSSSEGSPDVIRGIESVSISERSSTEQPEQTTLPVEKRGRNQVMSPVQGNGTPDTYASILRLPDTEVILFKSIVEARSLKRRASRLIPLPVPPSKTKTRELILTSRRLICLKQRSKRPGGISIKSELALQASEKLKEKDKEKESRGIVACVERKGEREFVVLTSSKAYSYATIDSSLASKWTEQLNNALASNGRQTSKGRT